MALGPGSIAFVGLNTDGNDNLAFVALETIEAGTVIFFQDNEWNGSAIGAGGAFNTGESSFSWTATSEIAAGTIVAIDNIGTGTIGSNTGTATFINSANRGFNNSDEVVYAFIGTSDTAPAVFLTAATNGNFASHGSIANTGLTAGANAIEFNNADDIFAFNGSRDDQTGFAAYGAIINNPANWVSQDASGDQSADGTAPDVPFSTVAFTTGDSVAPALSSSSPADNATGVPPGANIVLTFDEAVQKGTGNVLIKLVSDDSIVATIDVTSVNVAVAGDTVTINPPADLPANTAFYVTVDAGAFEDLAGNDFAGIASTTALNFASGSSNTIGGITILDAAESLEGNATTPTATNDVQLVRLGSYSPSAGSSGSPATGNAEVMSYDASTGRLYVLNTVGDQIDILQISPSGALTLVDEIDLSALTDFGAASEGTSVAVKNGIVAVSYKSATVGSNGHVAFFDTDGDLQNTVDVGVGPDMVTFTPDGSKLLVANEAEAVSAVNNSSGSISIISLAGGVGSASVTQTIGFTSLDGSLTALQAAGLPLLTGQNPSADIEPEYISISPDGTRAYVTLQEISAVAIIDLTNPTADRPLSILPLSGIDRTLAGNSFDASDTNGAGNFINADIISLLQPDTIATFAVGGDTYFVTANEGDARTLLEADIRLSSGAYTLDAGEYPNAAALESSIGRLKVIATVGNTDGDAEYEQMYSYGGRGISIFKQNADGTIVKVRETGGEFEHIVNAVAPGIFNQNQGNGAVDNRSDDKGPEPEGVDVGVINGRTYAFVSLERTGGVMIYDITDPATAFFVGYEQPTVDDKAPEGVKFISAADSPTGTALVITTNEGNEDDGFNGNGTTIYAALAEDYTQEVRFASSSLTVSHSEGQSGPTTYNFTVERTNGTLGAVDFTVEITSAAANSADFAGSPVLPIVINGTIAAGSSTATVSVDVQGDTGLEPNENFTATITAASTTQEGVTAAVAATQTSATGTIVNDDPVKISAIQGSGSASTMVGQTVTVEAIVVGDFQNGDGDARRNLNGFYLQEENADQDGNALTSEGLFVFQGSLPGVADLGLGDRVRVTGTVSEFNGSTQITATGVTILQADAVADISTMAATVDLSAATAIQRAGTVANSTTSFHSNLEAYEGMLVEFSDTLRVTEQFDLDRFVEVRLAAGDMPVNFTHENEPNVAGNAANLADIAARTIYYEDGISTQNTPIGNLDGFGPTYSTDNAPRMGDSVEELTGVLDFAFNQFRVRAVEDGANVFTDTNPRPAEPDDVGGTLKVASFNVLNYFKSIDTIQEATNGPDNPGDNTVLGHDPRGADSVAEFNRQTEKLVNVLMELDADVLGLVEIENDFLAGSSGNAIEHLVNALNAEIGTVTYSWVNPGQQFVGGDAIAVGFIYKTGVVQIADGTSAATLTDADFPGLGLGGLIAQSTVGGVFNGINTSRVPLAVTFEEIATGGEFTAVVNHLKSKSGTGTGADADQLDGQGNWQQQRELAATALTEWLETDPTGSGDSDVVLLGDFNAYFREDTIDILTGAGFENLQDALPDPYSYVFDGQRGALDYILTNGSLSGQVTGVTEWHINADEADALDYNLDFGRDANIFDGDALARVSDHDPLIIGLDLTEDPIVPAYTLQLLHLADGEAGLLASTTAPNLAALIDAFDDDYANTLILAGGDNWLPGPFLAAGTDLSVKSTLNAVTGSTISADPTVQIPVGAVDIAIHNAMGVQVSAIGNHEWDLGSRVFRDSFSPNLGANGWVGADFVHVSANLDFSGDADINPRFTNTLDGGTGTLIAEASALKGRIAPAVVITEGGEKIGFVGATTQILESISSPTGTEVKGFPGGPGANGEVDDMDLLAAQLQPIIDELIAEGVNKIILQAHLQQIANEVSLASKLRGVDIILAAGSNTRLGDADDEAVAFPGHGANFAGNYPLTVTDLDGKTTMIINTDNEYTYMGRLVVDFDANGDIILDSLTANQAINGAYASTEENVAEAWGVDIDDLDTTAFADGTKGDKVEKLVGAVDAVIQVKDGNVFGFTDVYLEGERGVIRNEETNLGSLSADANGYALEQALGSAASDTYVVSLKNGGGIRAQIGTLSAPDPVDGTVDKLPPPANPDAGKPEGGVSQLDVENSLRFNNRLMAFDTDAAGLKAIIEHGVAVLGNQGRFPQIGGVAFSYDPDLAAGSRIVSMALIDENGNAIVPLVQNGVVLADVPSTITVVTLNFTANGGDGYPVKANASNFRFLLNDGTLGPVVDEALNFTAPAVVPANALGEQQAFGEYMEAVHGTPETAYDDADTAASQDLRIENLNVRDDAVLPDGAIVGTGAGGTTDGSAGDDNIFAQGGDDDVVGYLGNDQINGGDGNDILRGRSGDDTLIGGQDDDILAGGAGNDELFGGAGNDHLNGGAGDDFMAGGSGNDVYLVYDASDQVVETALDGSDAGGADRVNASVSHTLSQFVETLALRGTDEIDGTGNSGDNLLIGNDAANELNGGAGDDVIRGGGGNDTIDGGAGRDVMTGGAGDDTFIIQLGTGTDVIKLLEAGDKIDLSDFGFADGDAVIDAFNQIGGNAVLNLGGGDKLILNDHDVTELTVGQFIV
jgi:predicted extracellular nuclease/Ca2+-binding RTX toxin-like protein